LGTAEMGPRIAARYRYKSDPAFPQRRAFNDADDIAGPSIQERGSNRGDHDMFSANSRVLLQGLTLALAIAGSAAIASAAVAGECPADTMKANAREKVDFKPVGVTDVTLGSIDLEKQPAHLKDRELRFRKLTIEPGGIVPWHSHDDRPALIFVQQGEIVEYASNCVDPIVHKAGDIRPEVFGTSHWWKNLGKETVILYVGDVRKDPHDHNM